MAERRKRSSRAPGSVLRQIYYRRAPHVISYWDEEGLVLENYAARTRVGVAPVAALVLSTASRWRTESDFCAEFPGYSAGSVRESVRLLARHKFLDRSARPSSGDNYLPHWREWTPAAAYFHFTTKDAKFNSDPFWEQRFYRERARQWKVPSPVKRLRGAQQIVLPAPMPGDRFTDVLRQRRTWRRFSAQGISLPQLSTLLHTTWGVQQWMKWPVLGRLARKTSPSGGARHPIEAYVLALRVKGLAPGIYHYAADRHRLELVRRGATTQMVEEFFPSQWWYRRAAAVFLMTAVFPRTQWKYPVPRTYRVVLADAGHLGQTFCLTATWLGLAPFCTMALADSKVERALRVDGVTESAIYATGVGMRPRDNRDPGDLPGQISPELASLHFSR